MAGTATSTLVVPSTLTSSITDINATIVLTHSLMADLDVTLVGPTAASTALFTDIGSTATGGQTVDGRWHGRPSGLTYRPLYRGQGHRLRAGNPPLATFNGLPAAGTWTLQLADDTTNASGGRLQSWSLEISGNPPPAYALELNKTVGLDPALTCATTASVTVPPGGFEVFYCDPACAIRV